MQAGRQSAHRIFHDIDVLPPDPVRRRREPQQASRALTIEDAVFEVIEADNDRFSRNYGGEPSKADGLASTLARLVAETAVRLVVMLERGLSHLSPQSFMTLLGGAFFVVFWLCGGFAAIASGAGMARAPLMLENVRADIVEQNGMRILELGGTLVNRGEATAERPVLMVMSKGRLKPIATVILGEDPIEPGQRIPFSGRFKLGGGKFGKISVLIAGN